MSLDFNQDIGALRNCPVSPYSPPEAAPAIYLTNSIYHLISCNPTMELTINSRTQGLSLSTIDLQACVLRPCCDTTTYIIQSDPVLSTDIDACKTTTELYITTTMLAPPLNQVFQKIPFEHLNFPSNSIGAARKLVIENAQMEMTKNLDVRRTDPGALQKLTEPEVAQHTSLNPATAAAFENFFPAKPCFLLSSRSIIFSLLFSPF